MGSNVRPPARYCHNWEGVEPYRNSSVRRHDVRSEKYTFLNTAELHFSGLIGTASHLDMQKIRKIGFLLENGLHWQAEGQLLQFTVCTCVQTFRPGLI